MLKKLDDLYKRIIIEETEELPSSWFRQITKDTEFLQKYILPLAKKYFVYPEKARMNTFRLTGTFKNVKDFLSNFKVDKEFLEQPKEFFICSPMYSFCDDAYTHILNRDEGFPVDTVDPYSTLASQNKFRFANFGRWYELIDDIDTVEQIRVKRCTPAEFAKLLSSKAYEDLYGINDDIVICIEFQVNCEGYTNQCFDMWSTFIPTEEIGDQQEIKDAEVELEMPQIKQKNNIPKFEELTFDKINKVKNKILKTTIK